MTESCDRFGAGLLLGAMLGLAIGILFAPKSGKEMRELIREKAEDTEHKAEKIIEEAREKAAKLIEDAKEKASEIMKKEGSEEAVSS